jgi:hypothetical protein
MCRIRILEGFSKYQQLKKKSAATALNTVLASAYIQMMDKVILNIATCIQLDATVCASVGIWSLFCCGVNGELRAPGEGIRVQSGCSVAV